MTQFAPGKVLNDRYRLDEELGRSRDRYGESTCFLSRAISDFLHMCRLTWEPRIRQALNHAKGLPCCMNRSDTVKAQKCT